MLEWLKEVSSWASKETHYQNLDEWFSAYNAKISFFLNKNGFKNGDLEHNNKLPDVVFWWHIYSYDPVDSYNLQTKVARHHSSVFEKIKQH